MFGILLDTVGIVLVVSIIARQNMMDEIYRFVFLALGLLLVGFFARFSGLPSAAVFATYFLALLCGMRFGIGASWLGLLIGAFLFVVYKILVTLMIGLMFKTA